MTKRKFVNIAFVFAVIAISFLFVWANDIRIFPDSYEYINIKGFDFIHGVVDKYRLPLYPLLIDVFMKISNNHYLILLIGFQVAVYLTSVYFFFETLSDKLNSKILPYIVVLLYVTCGCVIQYNNMILTESLSISLTIFIVCLLVRYIDNPKKGTVIALSILCIVGCMLKVIFCVYSAFILAFFIINIFWGDNFTNIKKWLFEIMVGLLPIIIVLVYAGCFYHQFGIYTLSCSGMGQSLYTIIDRDLYEDFSDKEIVQTITDVKNMLKEKEDGMPFSKKEYEDIDANVEKTQIDLFGKDSYKNVYYNNTFIVRLYLMSKFDAVRIKNFVDSANKTKLTIIHISDYISNPKPFFIKTSSNSVRTIITRILDISCSFINISIASELIVSALCLLFYIVLTIKRKKAQWIYLGLCLFILFTCIFSFIGTNAEFERTAITAVPFTFVGLAYIADNCFSLERRMQLENL